MYVSERSKRQRERGGYICMHTYVKNMKKTW